MIAGQFFVHIRIIQNAAEINSGSTGTVDVIPFLQQIGTANQFIHCADAQFCHIFSHFLSNKVHEIHYVFRFACKTFSQFRILGGNTHRAGIQIADTHHHTAHGNQRSSCETEFFCTQKGCNHHITACHQLAIGFNNDFITKIIHDQCLMGFCKTQLPGKSCIKYGTSGSCTGTAVKTGNQDNLCTCFGNTCCYRSDTGFGNQFYGNTGTSVGIFQIIDQLRQILNGINIVMRRR